MNVVWEPQPWQAAFIACPVEEVFGGGARGGGKRLSIDTLVPVPLSIDPSGFKTMGTLMPGDHVFSPRGEPVLVTWVSPVEDALRSYEVEFDTGEVIRADGDHLWHTMNKAERVAATKADPEWQARRRAKRPSRALPNPIRPRLREILVERNKRMAAERVNLPAPTGGVRTTEEIRDSLTVQNGREINHSVAITSAVELPEIALPIDPYLFGVWLGDGDAARGYVGMANVDLDAIAVFLPVPVWLYRDPNRRTSYTHVRFEGLTEKLRHLGVQKNKHIPRIYLRASIGQRMALLQGILDTDGHCDARGQIEIGLSDRRLAEGLHDLISGLGIKATMRTKVVTLYGKVHKPSHILKFMAPFPAFRLPRKLARQKLEGHRETVGRRYIVDVRKVAPLPMRCIKVAHPDGLYLIGRTMITTHNSDGVLGDWLNHADRYKENAIGLMVRRTRTELLETHERARVIYGKIGAKFTYQPMRTVMPGGGRLTFAYLDRDSDAESYQGASFSRIYVEECGNFPSPTPILKLMATLRSGAGVPVGMRLTGNPGGPGHQWCRARYIDPAPRGWKVITDPETGSERIYLPSRVAQNKYLGPDYVRRLRGVGTPELVRAWLEGDWSVVAGAFFSEFSADRHVIPPRTLPEHWARFRSFDWGSARPFAVHWWAVSDGTLPDIARGCLVCYREWYGMKPGEPNVGLHMTAEQVAEGIRDRERDDPKPKDGAMVGVADPSIFAEDGGPSIASRMTRAARIVFRPADNKRVPQRGAMGGWDQVRARLVGDADGKPMVVFFATCRDLIRTLPAMQHDASRAEDIDTEAEDHAVDSCFVAGTMVETARGAVPIERVMLTDQVMTRAGYRPVTAAFSVGEMPVFRVELSNGVTLTGTDDHPVFVDGYGFIPLHSLRYGDIMRPCQSRASVKRFRSSWASRITSAASTISAWVNACIALCGSTTTAAFRNARISIIETWIRTTTSLTISYASPLTSTCLTTVSYGPAKAPRSWQSTPDRQRQNGMDRLMGWRGIRSIGTKIVLPRCMRGKTAGATNAAYLTARSNGASSGFAPTPARLNGVETPGLITSSVDARLASRPFLLVGFHAGRTVLARVFNKPLPAGMIGLSQRIAAIIATFRSRPRTGAPSGAATAAGVPMTAENKKNYELLPSRVAVIIAAIRSWRQTRARFGAIAIASEPIAAGRQTVYNLSVAQAEEYFANGVLVHNCRYAMMSRPYVRDMEKPKPRDSWDVAFNRDDDPVRDWRVA